MENTAKAIVLSVLVMTLTACNTLVLQPTETPKPTETSLPTSTNTPEPTATPAIAPTSTPVPPTETPAELVLSLPSGEPSSEWEGIPIMPNALAGEGDSGGYAFTINASLDEIQQFYETELPKQGWSVFASGQGTTDAVILMFVKDAGILSVSIMPQPDGTMYVLLVK